MSTQWRIIHLVVTFITLAAAVPWLSSAPVLAQSSESSGCNNNDPGCLANNPDILGGEQAHNLLRTEDLMLLKVTPGGQPTNEFIQWRLNTSNSILATPSKLLQLSASGGTPVVAVGRMFNADKDTTVTILDSLGAYFMTIDERRQNVEGDSGRMKATNLVMADFTGDGFADLFTTGINQGFGPSMRVVTAQDVNTPFALKFGLPTESDRVFRMTVGDFNGDGRPEVAGLINNNGAYALGIYTVDPTTLTIRRAAIRALDGEAISVAAGRFGTLNYDQLVINRRTQSGVCCVVQAYDFKKGTLEPDPKGSLQIVTTSRFFSGPFIPGAYQQVLSTAVVDGSPTRISVGLLTFSRDGSLTPRLVGGNVATPTLNMGCVHDVAVGNFRQPNPNLNNTYDPRLNFAVAGTDCKNTARVQVFTVDTNALGTSVIYTSPQTLSFNLSAMPAGTFIRLTAGDLQGRSIPVGPPEKITITGKIQPDTILGVPPMHADWIKPDTDSAPTILNVSVFPGTFNSSYDFAQDTGTQASNQTTTSYTTAAKAFTELKKSWGIPILGSVTTTLKAAAQKKHEHTVANTYNTNKGQSFNLTADTVFDDLVAATTSSLNIYTYPVLGQCVDQPGAQPLDHCPAGKAPLHVQFSSSDNVTYTEFAEGRGLEWYQPVHEPGQLFSYPGSLAQLRAEQPQQPKADGPGTESSLQLLSGENVKWDPLASTQVSITWTQGAGRNVSSSTTNTHSFDSSLTFAGESKASGFEGEAGFEFNTSKATTTLNQSLNTYSESVGVVMKRGIPSTSNYRYQGQTFIFGQKSPLGTIQTDIPQNTDVKAQGFLSVGYAANPLSLSTGGIGSGIFWKQAYTVAPDVALNHSERWLSFKNSGQVQFNCPIGFTSSPGQPCTSTGQAPTPANVALALFYRMKGLFVTPGTTTDGPTTARATQGDKVTLRARVYNYSLKNMDADTKVRVQFYAQPWNAGTGQFLADDKGAFARAEFIGEDVLDPIPAFCGGPSQNPQEDPCTKFDAPRNWTFAQVRWDTSTVAAGTNWKFWVVVWMERNGQKVAEIQDHGLTAIPVRDPDDPDSHLNSLADVPVQTYSNNLGLYNQVFHVGRRTGVLQASAGSKQLKSRWENLPKSGALGANQMLTLGASHDVVGADMNNVMVLFYDGDPEQGGKLFDMEFIPHIAANEGFATRVPYSPKVCGTHLLFVRAIPMDGSAPTTTDVSTVTVECPPPSFSLTNVQGVAGNVGSGSSSGTLQVSGKVVGVRIPDLSTTTLELLDLLRESAGAGELARGSFGPVLPLQLTAQTGSNAKTAIFETPPAAITTPKVRVEITQANPNIAELNFSAQIEHVVINAPQGCGTSANGTVPLQTRFTLTSQARAPVEINTEQTWQCTGAQLKTP